MRPSPPGNALADFLLDITNCAGCGSVKLAHHICPSCYSQVTRQWKAKNRDIPDFS